MLITPIYNGSGLGNQLACYITTRCLALDKGYEFRVAFPERFKGYFFKDLYLPEVKGIEVPIEGQEPSKLPEGIKYYRESMANNGDYDDFIFNIPDNYIIHGNLQGEKYFENHKDEIREWLKVEPLEIEKNTCILSFRGGEYQYVPAFFLGLEYWQNAMNNMKKINPNIRFRVVTDDINCAKGFFPNLEVTHYMENDYRTINNTRYLILSNSTFSFFPAWTSTVLKYCIYPKYFGRHNISDGYWFLRQNLTKGWYAQDREGKLFDYDTCIKELEEYNKSNN